MGDIINTERALRTKRSWRIGITMSQEILLAIFVAGAPLAAFVLFHRDNAGVPVHLYVLALGALFAWGVAAIVAVQLLSFFRAMTSAVGRRRSGQLNYHVDPSPWWSADCRAIAEAENELAMEVDRLYEREWRIASRLQQMLVSPLPESLGPLSLADFYRAGHSGADIGGDFYALFTLPGNRAGLVFGDVTGRGLDAAVQIAALRFPVEAYAQSGMAAVDVVDRVNETFIRTHPGQLIPLVYMEIDLASGAVDLVNAGHEPPILRSGRPARWTTLKPQNSVIGISSDRPISSTFVLGPGDALVLYTDGVASAGPRRGSWSTDDLLRCVRNGPADPRSLVATVVAEAPINEDDAACVMIHYA